MNIRNHVFSFIRAALVIGALIAGGFVAPDDAHGQVGGPYSKFGPVNGIMKGSVSTYNTSPALSTDVTTLFCGTSTTLFLRADGTCAVPAGTGVTSVTETVPAGFAITGSPGTGAVSLAISYATGQSANLFLATPNGTTGALSERAIVGADLPPINLGSTANGGVASASILLGTNGGTSNGFFSVTGPTTSLKTFTFPNASANVLTDNAAVTVPQGGTNLQTLTAHGVLLGEGTSAVSPLVMGADTVLRGTASADPVALAVNNCGSSTTALSYSTSTHTFGCQTITGAGGNPGGSTTQLQYNNSSVFGGTAGLTWDNVNNKLTLTEASAGGDYLNLVSSNTTFIGYSAQVSTGHVYSMRASTGGFFISDGTNSTNPISFDTTGKITIDNPTTAGVVMSVGTTSYTGQQTLQVSTNSTHEGAVVANSSGASAACLSANNAGTAGQCSMPAGDTGVATTGTMFFHPGNGTIATDATTLTDNGVTMTPRQGTFTMTYNGFSAGNSLTATYYAIGNQVTLLIPGSAVSTSNTTTFTATGIPATIQPAQAQQLGMYTALCEDNSVIGGFTCGANISGGTISFAKNGNNSGWTASGQKGITTNLTVTYLTN